MAVLVVALGLASCLHVATDEAYVTPLKGQSGERRLQDTRECYRVAQGMAGTTTTGGNDGSGRFPVATPPSTAEVVTGAFVGAPAYLGFGLARTLKDEQEMARRFPPDPATYEACLTARGYDIQWPKGTGSKKPE